MFVGEFCEPYTDDLVGSDGLLSDLGGQCRIDARNRGEKRPLVRKGLELQNFPSSDPPDSLG